MRPLKTFVVLSSILLVLSVATCWYYSVRGPQVLGFSLLNLPSRAFDYWDYLPRFPYRHSSQFFTSQDPPGYEFYYPAPAIFLLAPFYHLDHSLLLSPVPDMARGTYRLRGYGAYVLVAVALFFGVALRVAAALRRRGVRRRDVAIVVGGTVLTAYPMFFALQRGNIEALAWLISAAAVWAFLSNRPRTAAVLIGTAGAVKLYPLLLVGLFLREKKLRAVLLSLATWLGVTLAGLFYLDPSLPQSARFVIVGVRDWTRDTSLVQSPPFDHSAFGLVKWLTVNLHPHLDRELHVYYSVAALCALGLFVKVLRQPPVNQILFLCCAAVTLPPTSFDYTLCLLYVPLAVIALGNAAQPTPRHPNLQRVVLVLLALLVAPEFFLNIGTLHGNPGALKAVCLILLMILSAFRPLDAVTATDALTPTDAVTTTDALTAVGKAGPDSALFGPV